MRAAKVKNIICLALCLALALCWPKTAEAKTSRLPDGISIIDADGIVVPVEGNYFLSGTELKPGDVIYKKLWIQNVNEDPAKVWLRDMGHAVTGPEDLGETTYMTITFNGNDVYRGNLNRTKIDYDKTDSGGPNRQMYIGEVWSESTSLMTIELKIDTSLKMRNSISTDTFQWRFIVRQGYGPEWIEMVQTGDTHNIYAYLAVGAVSLSAVVVFALTKRKKKDRTA